MTAAPPSLATALEDTYRLTRELGRGGMATVYLAEDVKHRRQVAVKVLHPELAAAIGATRFDREIEIAARLTHPHILMLIDSGEADGFLYYVMPFVDGESLRDRLEREKKLSIPDAVRINDQVAAALSYAHGQGVVHRDIKPGNILLSGDQAIVADFGIARAVEVAGGEKLTSTGLAVGTPAYMSPEQALGHEDIDGRTDVYAMGCVLFEMIAGRTPFVSSTPRALLAQHALQAPPSLRATDPEVPLFVARAVSRALAKEPAERFATPRDLAETLRSETVVETVGRKRLAVLPPVNVTADPEHQFLVLGLHEAMISQLGHGDVAVLARTSVVQCEGTEKPLREICRELTVDLAVESSLLRTRDSVAIQARLIDGNTEEALWSGSREGDVSNVLSLYRELSESIAAEIDGATGPATRPAEGPVVDLAAYERYMRGRVHQQNLTPHDLDRAMQYYEAALEIQPDYAQVYAGIALVWAARIVLGLSSGVEAGQKEHEAAERAVELDPNLAEGHQEMARAFTWVDYDWERGEQAFGRSIELDPNEPEARVFYSHFLAMLGRADESDAQIARALEIDPFNPFTQLMNGIRLGLTGRYTEGLEQLGKVPPNPLRSQALAYFHLREGRLSDGLAQYAQYFEMFGDQQMAAAMREDEAGPQAAMIRGAETLVERARDMYVKPGNIVHLFDWAGDVDRTLEWLERSYELRDSELAYMATPLLASAALRADPRFHNLLRRLDLPVPAS